MKWEKPSENVQYDQRGNHDRFAVNFAHDMNESSVNEKNELVFFRLKCVQSSDLLMRTRKTNENVYDIYIIILFTQNYCQLAMKTFHTVNVINNFHLRFQFHWKSIRYEWKTEKSHDLYLNLTRLSVEFSICTYFFFTFRIQITDQTKEMSWITIFI